MSATLTWSEYHGESNLQSTFAATNRGAMQLLNQYFTTLSGFADFPWEICSTELTTSPWYVTLKRKSGAAGRIIFMGISSSVGNTMNPQLTNGIGWTTVGVRAAWFPSATTDTPVNIISASGDVFTGSSGYTGLCPTSNMTYGTYNLSCWACADGIFLRYGTFATNGSMWLVGNMMEDNLGVEAGLAFSCSISMDSINPAASLSHTIAGGFSNVSGVTCQFGTGWQPTQTAMSASMRDNAAKKVWMLPRSLFSYQLPTGDGFRFKMRQVAYGPTPLAGFERIAVDGDITMALSTFPTATAGSPWLTNYQV